MWQLCGCVHLADNNMLLAIFSANAALRLHAEIMAMTKGHAGMTLTSFCSVAAFRYEMAQTRSSPGMSTQGYIMIRSVKVVPYSKISEFRQEVLRCLHSNVVLPATCWDKDRSWGLSVTTGKNPSPPVKQPTKSMATSSFLPYTGNLEMVKALYQCCYDIHFLLQSFQGACRNPSVWPVGICKAGICRNNLLGKAEKESAF